ncbi:helix-turn-helix domain-containing protein [Amycolatopsis sp. lyj-109]|uniref:helix-turn-helix domain-containing protein n=1 Tax=Amycolatopsis sp. lyj-109 TaxID=2789287 RepID=UPI0039794355
MVLSPSSSLFGDLVPGQANSVADFAGLLRQVRSRSGMTYDELARSSSNRPKSLAKSTMTDLFNGTRLPREHQLVTILLACGLPSDALEPWQRARARLETPQELDLVVVRNDFDDVSRDLGDRLVEARQEVSDLRRREQDLAARLAREETKCRQLEADLERLRAGRTAAGAVVSPGDVRREQDLHVLHDREREHIENMKAELAEINEARRQAEEQVELVAAESKDSRQQLGRVVDFMELHFTRAEYERRRREKLESQLEDAQRRIAQLQRVLALYQEPL